MVIKELLKDKNNIAIVGESGCGKSVVFKNILNNLMADNKKVLILEVTGEKEYNQITVNLGGDYIVYDEVKSVNYNSKLTTISFSREVGSMYAYPEIELISRLIKEAENKKVEVILIDGAREYLKECKKLINNIHAKLIVNTQFDSDIFIGYNATNFKNLFNVLFIMDSHRHNKQRLLDLYNIDQLIIEDLKDHQRYESIIVQDERILKRNFKVCIGDSYNSEEDYYSSLGAI